MAAPRVTIDQLPEQTAAVGTDLLVVQNGTVTKKLTMQRIVDSSATALAAHVTDATDAHLASSIGASPNSSPMVGTTVQTQLNEAATAIADLIARVTALETP